MSEGIGRKVLQLAGGQENDVGEGSEGFKTSYSLEIINSWDAS